jgi:aromatic ring-opening dioxygenase LigB subunit
MLCNQAADIQLEGLHVVEVRIVSKAGPDPFRSLYVVKGTL